MPRERVSIAGFLHGSRDPARLVILHELENTYELLLGRKLGFDEKKMLHSSVGVILDDVGTEGSVNVWENVKNDVSRLPRGFGGSFTRNQLLREAKRDPGIIASYLRLKRLGFIYEGRDGRQHVLGYKEAKRRAASLPSSKEELEEFMATSNSGWGRDDLLLEAESGNVEKIVPLEKLGDGRLLDVLDAVLRVGDKKQVKRVTDTLAGRLKHMGSGDRHRLKRIAKKYRRELSSAGIDNVESALSRGRATEVSGWRSYVRRFLETGNIGYVDMLLSERDEGMVGMYIRRLVEGDAVSAVEVLSMLSRRLDVYELLLLLKLAERLGRPLPRFFVRKLVEKRISSRGVKGRRKFVFARKGRVDVRRSLFRMIRLNRDFLVFRQRYRLARVSLVIDVSSSVAPYSSEVLLTAASLANNVSRIIVFSDNVLTIDARRIIERFHVLAGILEFGGYTDMATAIARGLKGVSRVVVVSDLRHNVGGLERVFSVVREGLARGVKMYFIAIGSPDRRVGRELERLGAVVLYLGGEEMDVRRLVRVARRLLV